MSSSVVPRISSVEALTIRGTRNYEVWVLVRVRTEDGLEGLGECFSWAWDDTPRALRIARTVGEIGGQLVGSPALEIQAFLSRFQPAGSGYEWHAAVSGIEIALWDLLGQVAGLPIYALLGGAARERIPLYANHGAFIGIDDREAKIERALACKEAGYPLFKWDPFQFRPDHGPPDIPDAVEEVAAFRAALGDDYELAIDCHGRLDLDGALEAVRALEPLRPAFIEEPVPPERPEWYRPVAEATSIPIAGGECVCTRSELQKLLDTGAIRVLQPEPGANGGLLETMRQAAMAEAVGATVAPHNWCGPVLTRATAHVAAAVPNLFRMEYASTNPADEWEPDLLEPPLRPENGFLPLPDGPGLGARLNEGALAERRLD